MFIEHDTVILTDAVMGDDGTGFLPGDVGCIIHIHGNNLAYVVEFASVAGATIDIATVTPEQVRAVTSGDLTHVRKAAPAR